MNPGENDTIVAISTPLSGEGGIGIVRLSGRNAFAIADKIFFCKNGKPSSFASHTIHYGWIKDIDEVLLSVMRSPRTYTREDIVEISGHGGPVVLRKILELCISEGARLALPGEFTKRAFLNGRIDLARAEAVADLIRSKTDYSASLAAQQIKGFFSKKINKLRKDFVKLLSDVEVNLDYPEEEAISGTALNLREKLNHLRTEINELLTASKKNKIFVSGIQAVIVGRPNVGKSSLLNAILTRKRAIVTPVAGTTRDVITETINLRGIPVTLMDTAGIKGGNSKKKSPDALAIKFAKSALAMADLALFVVDSSTHPDINDFKIARIITRLSKKTILVLNKSDLLKKSVKLEKSNSLEKSLGKNLIKKIHCSAIRGTGIQKLHDIIFDVITTGSKCASPDISDNTFIVNARQEEILNEVIKGLDETLETIEKNESSEFLALHLRDIIDGFSEITGVITTEEILNSIFSRFCVGK
ncbi:MAG: tRNA uridine-5-carboxymethylaminomethyl(34) synthesis GTPase MnmE [Elusimicrobiota bacterium]